MSQGNNNRNDVETTNTQRQRLVAGTLTCPPLELPTLLFDLLPEILCRLPVKLLVQLRCLFLTQTQLHIPSTLTNGNHGVRLICSCDGVFCGQLNNDSYFLWNPSITKFKLLPPLENHEWTSLSFGYDHFIDNYKVIVVSDENEVRVNTLGTDYWRKIEDIHCYTKYGPGIFVCGTVNWVSWDVIISLDLEKESCQELCPPDFGNENNWWNLGVLRDCLCVFAGSDEYWDVWIMKEYGNKEFWTKLYTIPTIVYAEFLQDQGLVVDQDLLVNAALYISEDDQLLVKCYQLDNNHGATLAYIKFVVYDSKTGTLNIPEFQNNYEHRDAIFYIESLISP
ncbi:F-box/kelch-repeat protein At3g23880 isoform X2 [Medicago truncatula]|uniref:F-box/kelch-repeat protein At3g23880 isoform X2 n=1 Tax=Medicago truncatula TaxID=3880 RepID=UPI000D2F2B7F|nr:F-box/kelch-repeat protein At3g23880 isoform X2 [Medicago truncatula]